MEPETRHRVLAALGVLERHQPGKHPQESHGGGLGDKVKAGLRDALKLADKIDLDPDEKLVGSDKVFGDGGTVRLALTTRGGDRSLRIGVGGSAFGSRDDEVGPWRAGPDPTAAINADRKRLRDEQEALEAEWDRLDAADGDPKRKAAIEARLEELDEADTGEVFPRGYTARLDQSGAERLHAILSEGFAAGQAHAAEINADYDKLDRLNDRRDKLDKESALWDSLTEEIERLEARLGEYDYTIYTEGSVPGEWADVHYRVDLDEIESGVKVHLAAVPPDSDLREVEGYEQSATLDTAVARKLLTLLGRYIAPAA